MVGFVIAWLCVASATLYLTIETPYRPPAMIAVLLGIVLTGSFVAAALRMIRPTRYPLAGMMGPRCARRTGIAGLPLPPCSTIDGMTAPPPRRWLQFGTGTLLVLSVIIALLLIYTVT